ncbi:cystathionine gamma-lyase [Ischnura elegans]|uniref:cystathionine gamma-lyase n=1 Tax=Ischnura elegans TaxID=197161 RepID=UPI001ED886A3|nr:cystathionine gamma-lyase [Ischnura elegans]
MAEGFLPFSPGFATKAIHAGQKPEQWSSNAVVPPISLSTTFKQIAPGKHKGFEYSRSGNPTRNVLEECIASLDGAKHGLVFSTGLGALVAVINHFKAGDHVVSVDDVYGGTGRYLTEVGEKFGVETTYVDASDIEKFKAAIRPNTKLVWLESPTNPTLKVLDIKKIAEIAHKHKDIIVVVDNTFLTSYFQRPLELGADIVMYSLTKYMNGHSDVVMGALCTNRDDLHESLRYLQNALGIVPSPFDCYLVNRGLKTLSLRMKQHMSNSLKVAHFLESHPLVIKVIHPGLPSHPQYEISRKQSSGCSGMLSFYMGNKDGKPATLEESTKFLQSLKIFSLAESLGGYESLAELPSIMTHASVPPERRELLGINDSLIRVSVGLEEADDLCNDLDRALKAAFA